MTKDLNGYATIPAHWEVATLPDAVFFQEGPGLRKWQWTDSGMKVINVTNILGDGQIDTNNTSRFISLEEYEKTYRHFSVDAGDIVVASSGNTYGKVGRISAKDVPLMMNTSVIRFRSSDPTKLNDEFLYAFLRSAMFRSQVESFVIGSAQPNFGPTHLKRMVMPLPPLPIQRRIAGILSAYDELIENSQRRIKILESMARALYREWFVHFRFPGHESVPRVQSPLGEIPKGWEVKKLGEICTRMESGGTPKRSTAEYWDDGEIDWYKTGELWDGFLFEAQEKITARGQRESTARLFEPGTILMAIYGSPTVGRMGILTAYASCNQAALGLNADKKIISQTYLYFILYSLRDHFNGLAQGAAQQNISKEKVSGAMAVVPSRKVLDLFDNQTVPIFDQVRTLQQQIQNLRRTRDLLLPRLLSGDLALEA